MQTIYIKFYKQKHFGDSFYYVHPNEEKRKAIFSLLKRRTINLSEMKAIEDLTNGAIKFKETIAPQND